MRDASRACGGSRPARARIEKVRAWSTATLARPHQAWRARVVRGYQPWAAFSPSGHHFAGFSNRFWKLLFDSRLVPERIAYEDDVRLPEWGFGITNIVARPTAGIDALEPREYVEGFPPCGERCCDIGPRPWRWSASPCSEPPSPTIVAPCRWDCRPSGLAGRPCSSCRTRAAATPTTAMRRCWRPIARSRASAAGAV